MDWIDQKGPKYKKTKLQKYHEPNDGMLKYFLPKTFMIPSNIKKINNCRYSNTEFKIQKRQKS